MALFFYKEKNKDIRAAAYLRLSIEDGDKAESNSIGNQRELIRDFAAERPGLHLVEEYADDGYTGTNFERPGFKRMMEDIKSGKINCIIVKDLSRLGRNYIEMGKYLEQFFPMMGIRFIAINDNYDNANTESSDSDSIVVPFKNLLNDSYCRDISIKVRSQLDMKRRKGRKKTPRLTKTYDVKIIPATVGVVAETEEPPKKRVAAYCRVSTDQEVQETSLEEQMAHFNTVIAEHPDWELAGIYADEGISGTQVKHRVQFQQMIEDAKAKKIDLILTKSISRFARNVVDCLTNIRLLRNLRPPVSVYFDKERLDSLDEKAEVFLTMLASFAQEESRSISTNIKWATRSRMKAGTQKISTTSLLGYDTDDDGEMVIVTNEAEIVRTIYMSFDKGMHPAEIAEKLNALEIRTIKNNPWTGESVKNILRNEKYCGDVLMQKTYTVDCLTHKTKKNEGEVEQYFIPDHHPAIVEREVWDKAQVRLEQIAGKRRRIRQKQQRLIPLRKGVLLGFVPIRPTWKAVSLKRLETATEKVMALVDTKPEQVHIEYESEECEMEILKGFEVINLKQPKGESVMTVTSNSLKFNKATAVELNYAPYIKVLLNAKTRQIAIQPCSEKDPNAIKFSNEESKQTYAISIKVPAIQVEFRRMLPFEDDNGGKLSYTLNGTLYPDEQVVIYDIGDVKPETEKKRRGRRKKSEIEAEQKEN